jgi:hypothetical protein
MKGVKYKLDENGFFFLKRFIFFVFEIFLVKLIRMMRAVLISMREVHLPCLDHHHS